MKKYVIILNIFLLAIPILTFADSAPNLCPFTETIVVKNAPANTHVFPQITSTGGIEGHWQGNSQFTITNTQRNCKDDGTVTATIGVDATNNAEITFHDGAYAWLKIKDPVINHGTFKFDKWNPDYTRHYYELNFVSTEANKV